MQIEGKYNSADVKRDTGDPNAIDQIRSMVEHEAFAGDDDVAIMPDFHWGKGAVIGFTMPLHDRIVPGTVGVDIGCGVYGLRLPGYTNLNEHAKLNRFDNAIRERIPTGFNVHDRNDQHYHMHEDFPWETCQQKLDTFNQHSAFDTIQVNYGGYGPDYYDALLERVGYDPGRATNSMGTLGGGNHFIEVGMMENKPPHATGHPYWVVIHSGSRGLGATIADHWMDKATDTRSATSVREHFTETVPEEYLDYLKFDPAEVTDYELLNWIQGGQGEDFVDFDALKDEYAEDSPETIQEVSDALKTALDFTDTSERDTDLDYLEGEQAHGYVRDMIFAQTYAAESRRLMAEAVLDEWNKLFGAESHWRNNDPEKPNGEAIETLESVHNYIDFEDQIIRKGACRAHNDEGVIIPLNMSYGTLIAEGNGDTSWNHSAPHGAGRTMSRRAAKDKYTVNDMQAATEGVYMSEQPVDETPQAYKSPEAIEEAIGETVEVRDRIVPVLSVKAK